MGNMSAPLVTIGMPTYNRADTFLRHALKSATGQTYPNIEIVVSDNCSPDDTEGVVKSFNDPRIRYFRQPENIGPVRNPNFCVSQARGDYFFQLHDDDMIDEDFVESCIKAAGCSSEMGIIQTGVRVIDAEGRIVKEKRNTASGESIEDFFRGWFSGKSSWYLCNTMFNAKRLNEIGGFPVSQVDDGMVISRLVNYGVAMVEEVKASFRKHSGEITFAIKVGEWCDDFLVLLEQMTEAVPEERRAELRKEGMMFFSKLGYNRAGAIKHPLRRFMAFLTVLRKFNYGYFPGRRHLPAPLYYPVRMLSKLL
jgi:glycosyltransferase involved in cell wall biosynthesis